MKPSDKAIEMFNKAREEAHTMLIEKGILRTSDPWDIDFHEMIDKSFDRRIIEMLKELADASL